MAATTPRPTMSSLRAVAPCGGAPTHSPAFRSASLISVPMSRLRAATMICIVGVLALAVAREAISRYKRTLAPAATTKAKMSTVRNLWFINFDFQEPLPHGRGCGRTGAVPYYEDAVLSWLLVVDQIVLTLVPA